MDAPLNPCAETQHQQEEIALWWAQLPTRRFLMSVAFACTLLIAASNLAIAWTRSRVSSELSSFAAESRQWRADTTGTLAAILTGQREFISELETLNIASTIAEIRADVRTLVAMKQGNEEEAASPPRDE